MFRLLLLAAPMVLLSPVHAGAAAIGLPGAPSPAFSMRASVGLGYSSLALDNRASERDDLQRLQIVSRLSLIPVDWLEFGGTLMAADARRSRTKFRGNMGVGGGVDLRFYPILQERFEINVAIGGGALFIRNEGDTPGTISPRGTRVDDSLRTRQYHAELILSRAFDTWNLYGGVIWNRNKVLQDFIPSDLDPGLDDVQEVFPAGLVVGVDYFITPLVFFSIEGQNFHEDTITGTIGILLAPHGSDETDEGT